MGRMPGAGVAAGEWPPLSKAIATRKTVTNERNSRSDATACCSQSREAGVYMGVTFVTSHTVKTKRKRSLSPGAGARWRAPDPEVRAERGPWCHPAHPGGRSRSFLVCFSPLQSTQLSRSCCSLHGTLRLKLMVGWSTPLPARRCDKAERRTSPLSPPRASVECLARSAPTGGPDPYTSSCHLSERGREHL